MFDFLDVPLAKRKVIGELYRKEFSSLSKIKLINYKDYWKPNYQIFPVHVVDREGFAEFMWERGIQVNG